MFVMSISKMRVIVKYLGLSKKKKKKKKQSKDLTNLLKMKIRSYSDEKTTLLSKTHFNVMPSKVLLQLIFYLQKFTFHNIKTNQLS